MYLDKIENMRFFLFLYFVHHYTIAIEAPRSRYKTQNRKSEFCILYTPLGPTLAVCTKISRTTRAVPHEVISSADAACRLKRGLSLNGTREVRTRKVATCSAISLQWERKQNWRTPKLNMEIKSR